MEQNQAISDILETVTFIKDHAITREEFTKEITGIKAAMVTKDYLDDKVGEEMKHLFQLEPFQQII